jgi:hypothetical protein
MFMGGRDHIPIPSFPTNRPNSKAAAEVAIHPKCLSACLDCQDKLFGSFYLAPLASTWENQRLGLACQTHLSNHIQGSLNKIKYINNSQCSTTNLIADQDSNTDYASAIDDGWKFYDGPLCGDRIPDDEEYHGMCTQDKINVDGSLISPLSLLFPTELLR